MSDEIVVYTDRLTWADMSILFSLQEMGSGISAENVTDITALFDRVVEGGAAAVPVLRTMEAIQKLIEGLSGMADTKNLSSASRPTSGQKAPRRRNT